MTTNKDSAVDKSTQTLKSLSGPSSEVEPAGSEETVSPQRPNPAAANHAVSTEVASWEGVTTHEHRFGGVEFRVGRREIGHLHGSRWADLPFHKGIRDMLVET